jgi:AraC family transcriptional regulator
MLYESSPPNVQCAVSILPRRLPIEGSMFVELLADMRTALDHDPQTAHQCLDRLAALLGKSVFHGEDDEVLIPATVGLAGGAPVKGGLAPWQLKRVVRHIEGNLSGPVFVEALASVAGLSSGHFCRAFKISVGETPHNFLVRQRVRRAQTLMLNTSDTLSQIACACGLTDQAHLTRLFRKFVGDTPLTWRRTMQHA